MEGLCYITLHCDIFQPFNITIRALIVITLTDWMWQALNNESIILMIITVYYLHRIIKNSALLAIFCDIWSILLIIVCVSH